MKIKKGFFKYLNTQSGSIVGSLVAFSIMGVSTIGLLQYMVHFKSSMSSSVESREHDKFISYTAISQLQSLLVEKNISETGKPVSRNIYGICSLLERPIRSHGVENVRLNFGYIKTKTTNWSKQRWKVFFQEPEWVIVPQSKCHKIDKEFSESLLKRCIEYRGSRKNTATRVYVIAEIIPVEFPVEGTQKEISINSNIKSDPKDAAFMLSVKVGSYYLPQATPSKNKTPSKKEEKKEIKQQMYIHYMSDLVRPDSVGECHIKAKDNQWTIVQLNATGFGTSFVNLVVNDSLYEEQKICKQMKVLDLNADIVQAGRIKDLSVRSISALNASLTCTINTFRCKGNSFSNDDIDEFTFRFGLLNNNSNPVKINKINITFVNKKGKEIDSTANNKLDNIDIDLYASGDLINPFLQANKTSKKYFSLKGEEMFTAQR